MSNTRKQNALKHGIFSSPAILPGEDPREFEKFRAKIFEKWQPNGATEEDAALEIVRGMWLKTRYENYKRIKIADIATTPSSQIQQKRINKLLEEEIYPIAKDIIERLGQSVAQMHRDGANKPVDRSEDLVSDLLGFSRSLMSESASFIVELNIRLLRSEISKHLNDNFPRKNFSSTPDWISALKKEVDEVLLPQARNTLRELTDVPDLRPVLSFQSPDAILQDIALNERINAMIDKAVKRLICIRAFKQIDHNSRVRNTIKQIEA